MKLFSNLDLIFYHIREISCLSFPGTLMKQHRALGRAHWLYTMLRLSKIFLLWFGYMIYFKIVILLCLQSLQLILAFPLPLPSLPHTCTSDQSFSKNKVNDGKSVSFLHLQSHCQLSAVLKKGSHYFFKCGGQVQEDSFALPTATWAILTVRLKHPKRK